MAKGPEESKASESTAPSAMPFDISKVMGSLDPNKLMADVSDALKQMRVPGLDTDAIVAAQKKNVEALTNANRAVVEGLQSLVKRQAQVLQETINHAAEAIRDLGKSGSPTDVAARQTELAKAAFERAISTMQELANIVSKSGQEASNAINARISSSFDEIKELIQKAKK